MNKRFTTDKYPLLLGMSASFAAGGLLVVAAYFLLFSFHMHEQAPDGLDYGIPVVDLRKLVEDVAADHPDCRIVTVRKHYESLEITTESDPDSLSPSSFMSYRTLFGWDTASPPDPDQKGITPAELLEILSLVSAEPASFDKNILSIDIREWKVKVRTGRTNHNQGGNGDILFLEKHKKGWIRTGKGGWIS